MGSGLLSPPPLPRGPPPPLLAQPRGTGSLEAGGMALGSALTPIALCLFVRHTDQHI